MKRALVLCAFFAIGCGPAMKGAETPKLPPAKPEAVQAVKDAARSVRLGPANYERALDRLDQAIALDDHVWEAHYDRGWLYLKLHRASEAVPELEKARAQVPGRAEVVRALGEAYLATGRAGDAASAYRDYLDRSGAKADASVRVALAGALRRAGKLDDAIEAARLALRQAQKSELPSALNEMALIYLAKGQLELADLVLHKALDLDGTSKVAAQTWNNLGLVALKRRRDQDAFAAFDQAAKLDPQLTVARRNKAVVYLDCGDYPRAAGELKHVTHADADDVQAWVALGVAERGSGDLPAAKRAYEHALTLEPSQPDALYDLGVLAMDFTRRPAEAEKQLAAFLKVAPAAHPKRADAESRMKDLARALAKPAPAGSQSKPGGGA
ncbi:MAG TPA: tetratricopeptide repeat protein [Polyangia bacterium]